MAWIGPSVTAAIFLTFLLTVQGVQYFEEVPRNL